MPLQPDGLTFVQSETVVRTPSASVFLDHRSAETTEWFHDNMRET